MSIPSDADPRATPASERGAIDAGRAGDKVAGFDPAAVPMEADAEAGGSATAPETGSRLSDVPVEPSFNAAGHGTAMRAFSGEPHSRGLGGWPILILLGVVAIAAAVFLGVGWGGR